MASDPSTVAETPNTVAERVLVSERLNGVDGRLDSVDKRLEFIHDTMQDLHVAMWRLVEIAEAREQRTIAESARAAQERADVAKARKEAADRDAAESSAWQAWFRSMVSRDVIFPVLAALGAGGLGYGVRSAPHAEPTAVAGPVQTTTGATQIITDPSKDRVEP